MGAEMDGRRPPRANGVRRAAARSVQTGNAPMPLGQSLVRNSMAAGVTSLLRPQTSENLQPNAMTFRQRGAKLAPTTYLDDPIDPSRRDRCEHGRKHVPQSDDQRAQPDAVSSLRVLTASIAHEVNQPLSGIITNASACLRMLSADPPNLDGARETARRTIRDANRAADIINRLRALFAGTEIATEPVDLNEAVVRGARVVPR